MICKAFQSALIANDRLRLAFPPLQLRNEIIRCGSKMLYPRQILEPWRMVVLDLSIATVFQQIAERRSGFILTFGNINISGLNAVVLQKEVSH